jgi:hypothetical protein
MHTLAQRQKISTLTIRYYSNVNLDSVIRSRVSSLIFIGSEMARSPKVMDFS